jgi:hypothetical protein
MSWWTNLRDTVEGVATGGLAGLVNDSLGNKEGALFNKLTGRPSSAEKRQQAAMMNDQIKAYKDQTELTRQEIASKRNEENVEKRRVQEKQIRALRRSSRGGGFLGTQSTSQPGMNDKLGG